MTAPVKRESSPPRRMDDRTFEKLGKLLGDFGLNRISRTGF
jgi:hypothetical protein